MNQNALHWAAKRGLVSMAELLLKNGIDFYWKDMAGRTPLDLANKNEAFEVAKIIEYYEINQKNKRETENMELEKIDLNYN